MNSFSVRCIFAGTPYRTVGLRKLTKERVTLWRAEDIRAAIELAEQEADRYASEFGEEFLNGLQTYELAEPLDAHGVEVFSLLRDSKLDPSAYIGTFFDTGSERLQTDT